MVYGKVNSPRNRNSDRTLPGASYLVAGSLAKIQFYAPLTTRVFFSLRRAE
jgi:hypothetical protein